MKRGGRLVRAREAAHRLKLWCPDCSGAAGLSWSVTQARWVVEVLHEPTCPVLRSARVRRAVDRYLIDLVAALYVTADYEGPDGGDVVARHRRGPAPVR